MQPWCYPPFTGQPLSTDNKPYLSYALSADNSQAVELTTKKATTQHAGGGPPGHSFRFPCSPVASAFISRSRCRRFFSRCSALSCCSISRSSFSAAWRAIASRFRCPRLRFFLGTVQLRPPIVLVPGGYDVNHGAASRAAGPVLGGHG